MKETGSVWNSCDKISAGLSKGYNTNIVCVCVSVCACVYVCVCVVCECVCVREYVCVIMYNCPTL